MSDWQLTVELFWPAIVVALLMAASCAVLSVYIVQRRMAMIADGVAHAGFGGMAIALLVGWWVGWTGDTATLGEQVITGLFCMAAALGIGLIARERRVGEDAAIGILLVASVALGMLLLAWRQRLPGGRMPVSLEALLFGRFTTAGETDVLMAAGVTALVAVVVGLNYHAMLYVTLDETMARLSGVRTRWIHALQLMLISLVIVVGVRVAGFLMVTALTVIPGATAGMLARRFGGVMVWSVVVAVTATVVALGLALFTPLNEYPSGPILVLTLFAVFVAVWGVRRWRGKGS
ncbi:MAG: metal ABC transporter permease [Phycisphaerae bacterium]